VALFLLKLTLTPLLIGGASLAARRWGPSVGGWIVALPLTSGPVALYLALDRGTVFAAATAKGSIGGLLGDAAFALAYGLLARRFGWPASLLGGLVGFAVAVVAIQPLLGTPALLVFCAVAVAMAILLWLAPPAVEARDPAPLPAWDIPARMVVGTAIVLAITQAAGLLGAQLSGVLAALPVYVSVLAVFAHQLEGPNQALGVVRGLQIGLFGTIVFFLVVTSAIEPLGIVPAFAVALAAVAAIQSLSLRVLRRPVTPAVPVP
jgi:F0F1-type ATP synthase assembly protein I